MSEAKHTKGPWFVSAECAEIVVSEDSIYGVWVAECGNPGGDERSPDPGEAAANAHLIAAAPDLLNALKLMLFGPTIEQQDGIDVASIARAAIAKAEGRAA